MISAKEVIMEPEHVRHEVWTPSAEHRYAEHRIARAREPSQRILRAFARWLSGSRGLSPGSVTVRLGSACWFVDAVTTQVGSSGPREAFSRLDADGVERLFIRFGKDHGMAARRSMQAAMRLFLRFAAERGWTASELVDAVPKLHSYRLSELPKGISDEHIELVLAAPWTRGRTRLRDRAILLLLATYGMRRGQVSALCLADLDWHARTVRIERHKGGTEICHALTAAVAQGLAEYLQQERPATEDQHVFLRATPPHVRLSPMAITEIVRLRLLRCGLDAQGPHAFRHAFATRLLRVGQPLKAIADLLGHRSLATVSIYAKVDRERLLACAVEWPEVTP